MIGQQPEPLRPVARRLARDAACALPGARVAVGQRARLVPDERLEAQRRVRVGERVGGGEEPGDGRRRVALERTRQLDRVAHSRTQLRGHVARAEARRLCASQVQTLKKKE